MTPRFESSYFRTYPAIAPATRRTLSKVKSSAMIPRHPSVPNLISFRMGNAVSLCSFGLQFQGKRECGSQPTCTQPETRNWKLCQPAHFLFVKILHDLAHVLGVMTRCDQQRIGGFHDYQITHSDSGDKLAGSVHVVPPRVKGKDSRTRNQVSLGRSALRIVVFMQRGPRSQVVPAEIGGQTENVAALLALGRSRLEYGIVDADVLTFGIKPAKCCRKLGRAE